MRDYGLFIGEKDPAFLNMVLQLAERADAARRELYFVGLTVPSYEGLRQTRGSGLN